MSDLKSILRRALFENPLVNPLEALGPFIAAAQTRSLPEMKDDTMVFRGDIETPLTVGHAVTVPTKSVGGVSPEDAERHEMRHVAQQEELGPLALALILASAPLPRDVRPMERDATSHELRMGPEAEKEYRKSSLLPFIEDYFKSRLGR